MPTLLDKQIVDDFLDSVMEDIINPSQMPDIMRTAPALDVHTRNPDDIAYTINHYFKSQNKKTIYFCDYKESPNPRFLDLMRDSTILLIEKYGFELNQIKYISGYLPVASNFIKIPQLYKDFDIPFIENKNVFYFEEEWKRVINSNEKYPVFNDLSPLHSRNLRQKKFLFLMGAPRPHRLALLDFFIRQNYIKDCFYSCLSDKNTLLAKIYSSHNHPSNNKIELDFSQMLSSIVSFKENFPKTLTSTLGDNPSQHFFSKGDIYYHSESYYSIIPETSFYKKFDEKDNEDPFNFHLSNFLFITEKTMRAIGALHPFILLSRPHSLQGLRELGYQTFHPYIDETYDEIENDKTRFELIKKEIIKLNNKTDSEWLRFQHDIYPIVKHNHDWLRADKQRRVSFHPSAI